MCCMLVMLARCSTAELSGVADLCVNTGSLLVRIMCDLCVHSQNGPHTCGSSLEVGNLVYRHHQRLDMSDASSWGDVSPAAPVDLSDAESWLQRWKLCTPPRPKRRHRDPRAAKAKRRTGLMMWWQRTCRRSSPLLCRSAGGWGGRERSAR